MSDLSSAGRPQGRAFAQEMRRRQARKAARGHAAVAVRTQAPAMSAPSGPQVPSEVQAAKPRGREAALARRAQRCAGALCWSDPNERRRDTDRRPQSEPMTGDEAHTQTPSGTSEEAVLESVCETVEAEPGTFGWRDNAVRKMCKARRRSLAQHGKVAVTVRQGLLSAAARAQGPEAGRTREFARAHRRELALHGRGSAEPARPSGRQRPSRIQGPQKVEMGTTLAGRPVTGTQVDRTAPITGIEAGSCRTITGTEYLGSEHYARFCDTRPRPTPAKVRIGRTGRGVGVSGTAVGRGQAVTGDEAGSCRPVTGTEYLSRDNFAAFCEGEPALGPEKVALGTTERRGLPVSGSDEARVNRVTGSEPGAAARVTGSQYADAGVARMTINGAPRKVAQTHTLSGRSVSGTTVDTTNRITGLEAGECRALTGTEYLSQESFRSLCRTKPEPAPAKVGESLTDKRQRITGNLVDRSENVTGNEPGSCQRVTGTGYNGPQLCGGGVGKVQTMTGLGGAGVTGTGFDKLPQTTGDDRGECWPVTGTAYHGREHYAQCARTPQAGAQKVGLTRTGTGLLVSGPLLGPDDAVTGNEAGEHLAVTGTPYAGREERPMPPAGRPAAGPGTGKTEGSEGSCGGKGSCGCKARFQELEDRLRLLQGQVASPAPGPSSQRFVATAKAAAPADVSPVPSDFSVVPPAQQGRSRITGSAGDGGRRITGPINLGGGLVTGTPEFRSRDAVAPPARAPEASSPAAPEDGSPPVAGAWRITGDDWSRGDRVTGTEGHWAQGRNPTQRGAIRSCVMSAVGNKERPLAVPVPEGKITGSSGNTPKGSVVTYSGGARG